MVTCDVYLWKIVEAEIWLRNFCLWQQGSGISSLSPWMMLRVNNEDVRRGSQWDDFLCRSNYLNWPMLCSEIFFFFFYFTLNETSISKGTVQHSEVSEVLLPCRLWSRHASVHSRNVKWQQAEVDCWDETLHAEAFAGAHGLLNIPGLTVSNSRSVWS